MASDGPPAAAVSRQHFLAFEAVRDRERVREIALELANHYARLTLSAKKWKKQPSARCRWLRRVRKAAVEWGVVDDAEEVTEYLSEPFHLRDFVNDLAKTGEFDHEKYKLPDPMCY